MRRKIYHVQLIDYKHVQIAIFILPFALAIGLSLLIAVLTVSVQSFKVARSNPADALKYE